MGVERAVTRWYAQRQLILNEIAALEEKLTLREAANSSAEKDLTEANEALAKAQEKLHSLGPCPKPMMG